MNILSGNITDIITEEDISLVKVDAADTTFTTIVIDTPERSAYLRKGGSVRLLFKETEVMIATPGPLSISVQNRIQCHIKNIKSGKILCELTLGLEGDSLEIRSIITLNACKQLALQRGDNVIALIKTNEVSLSSHD